MYHGDLEFTTAENELPNRMADYHHEGGQELISEMLNETNETAKCILRDYCRYSAERFNQIYQDLRPQMTNPNSHACTSADESADIVAQRLTGFTDDERSEIWTILDEIKVLNYLNLNLEVKYGFKGWAGLMHILVFVACREVTGIEFDVYAMHNVLQIDNR
jgi:hypothetical protein